MGEVAAHRELLEEVHPVDWDIVGALDLHGLVVAGADELDGGGREALLEFNELGNAGVVNPPVAWVKAGLDGELALIGSEDAVFKVDDDFADLLGEAHEVLHVAVGDEESAEDLLSAGGTGCLNSEWSAWVVGCACGDDGGVDVADGLSLRVDCGSEPGDFGERDNGCGGCGHFLLCVVCFRFGK